MSLFANDIPHLSEEVFSEAVLAKAELTSILESLSGQPASASLAVIDPLVLAGEGDEETLRDILHDKSGFSSYARLVTTLLLHFLQRRDLARQNLWALQHIYALRIYAQDIIDVPQAPSPIFGNTVNRIELSGLVQKMDQIAAYLLSEDHEEGWLGQLATRLAQNKTDANSLDLQRLLNTLINQKEGLNTHREARILRFVLQHLFASAAKADAEAWLVLARSVEKTGTLVGDEPFIPLPITQNYSGYSSPRSPRDLIFRYTVRTRTCEAR